MVLPLELDKLEQISAECEIVGKADSVVRRAEGLYQQL